MALSPYLNPTNLNGALTSSSKIGERLWRSDQWDALDKRNHSYVGTKDGRFAVATGNLYNAANQTISSIKDITDTIENARGQRAPMYRIGAIEKEAGELSGTWGSWWAPDEVKGLVRAVSKSKEYEQEGIIIDGIGEADGTFNISFSSNPVLFRADQVIDNRFREPAKLTMTVFVSNYLNDDIGDTIADAVSALDPTGLLDGAKNLLAYDGNTRAQYALYKLRFLMENAKPFQVYTPHGIYDNMLIKSIRPQTRPDTMDMLYCTIDFQEMILYSPLSDGLGKQPTRKGVAKERAGWTKDAAKKLKELI